MNHKRLIAVGVVVVTAAALLAYSTSSAKEEQRGYYKWEASSSWTPRETEAEADVDPFRD